MRTATSTRPHVALSLSIAIVLACGCRPVEDTRKSEPDAAIVDAGAFVERFCAEEAADGGVCACFANTCQRVCGPGECQDLHLVCPRGQDCIFQCDGPGACDGLVLDCETNDADCAISCSNGACARTRFRCTDLFGYNCCLCESSSGEFDCPRGSGPTSCDVDPS